MPKIGDYYQPEGSTEKYLVQSDPSAPRGFGVVRGGPKDEFVKLDGPAAPIRQAPTGDPIATAYERLAASPTEDDRQNIRAQALRDVQSQLDAQRAFYTAQRATEQARLQKTAQLSAKRVNALTAARGMAGSSIAEAEKGTQAGLSADQEALSMANLNSQQAAAEAALTGAATTGADTQYAAQLKASQDAELKRLDYMASLAPKAQGAITVSAGQSVIDPNTGEVIYQSTPEDEGKTYTLSPGQTVVDSLGNVIYRAPELDKEAKTITLSPGQVAFDANGNVIASVPSDATEGKTYTLSAGQTVFDAQGEPIASLPDKPSASDKPFIVSPGSTVFDPATKLPIYTAPDAKEGQVTYTLSPGQRLVDGSGKTIAENPSASADGKPVTVSPGETVVDSATGEVIYQGRAETSSSEVSTIVSLIDEITKSPFMSDVFGLSTLNPLNYIPGSPVAYVRSQVKQLKSFLALENRQKLKGQGTISDREFKVLTDAATALDSNLSVADARKELAKIRDVLSSKVASATPISPEQKTAVMEALRDYPIDQVISYYKSNGGTGTLIDISHALGITDAEYVAKANELGKDGNKMLAWLKERAGLPKAEAPATGGDIKEVSIGSSKVKVSSQIADKVSAADAEFYKATGKHLSINQSYRTYADQKAIRDRFGYTSDSQPSGYNGLPLAAPPGRSFHEKGLAIDVTNWKEAEPYLRKYGLLNEPADDRGHFSWGEWS